MSSGVRLFQKLCRDVLQKRKKMARNLAKVAKPGSGALEAGSAKVKSFTETKAGGNNSFFV